jgi:carboxypeptidase D
MSGMLIYDPVITWDEVQEPIPTVLFTDCESFPINRYFFLMLQLINFHHPDWGGLFPFNDTFKADIHARDKKCGYTDWVNKYLVYPPTGHIPMPLPGTDETGTTLDECWNIYWDVWDAATALNPCFDIYQVATTCPLLWDVLGFPGSFGYLPEGASVYFDRADVKAAINAPADVTWEECASQDVFVGGTDSSPPSGLKVLPHVIEATQNVIIAHGALDMILLANGTLLGIQNMSWGGAIGFQTKPVEPFYVPYHDDNLATLAAEGVFGTTHTERGLTYVGVDLAGHMIPQYAPSAAYRQLEFMLGRVNCMNCTVPFTSQPDYPQSTQPLGLGTAPQGWSNANGSCKKRSAKTRKLRK